jgi:hypothetical protein
MKIFKYKIFKNEEYFKREKKVLLHTFYAFLKVEIQKGKKQRKILKICSY